MNKDSRIYVAGHRGLVGSAIVRRLQGLGFSNLLMCTHRELDLVDQAQVRAFFETDKPEFVFLAAAKVGGIHANNTYPAGLRLLPLTPVDILKPYDIILPQITP